MSAEGIQADVPIPDRVEAQPEAPKPEISLREELTNAMKETQKGPEAESEEAKAARLRDDQGRFAAESDKTKRAILTLKEPAAPVVPEAVAPPVTPAAPATKPPAGWNAAMKEEFGKLPPNLQTYIAAQESEMRGVITARDDDRSFGKKIKETAAPFMATILSEGGTVDQAFQQFLTTAQILRGNNTQLKAQALRSIAQQFNVDLGTPHDQAPRNPQLETLQERLDRIERDRNEEVRQRQIQEQSSLSSEIESFAAAPGHEHFEAVKTLMGNLLQSGEAKTLQEAYDQAIWAKPEIRSSLAEAQQRQAQEKRDTEAKAKADAARQAAGSITGSPGGVKPNGQIPERSLGDEIRANFRAATGSI